VRERALALSLSLTQHLNLHAVGAAYVQRVLIHFSVCVLAFSIKKEKAPNVAMSNLPSLVFCDDSLETEEEEEGEREQERKKESEKQRTLRSFIW
jgi:hypothetical protein